MITRYETIMNLDSIEFADFLNELEDDVPWVHWFDEKYCRNCESIKCILETNKEIECSYCELNDNKCKFFNKELLSKDIINLWLTEKDADSL